MTVRRRVGEYNANSGGTAEAYKAFVPERISSGGKGLFRTLLSDTIWKGEPHERRQRRTHPLQDLSLRRRDAYLLVQHPGRHEEQAGSPPEPRYDAAHGLRGPPPGLLRRAGPPGTRRDDSLHRDPAGDPRLLQNVPPLSPHPRLLPGREAPDPGQDLLQI